MDDFQLLLDLHKRAQRQGPGSDAATRQAMEMTGLDLSRPLRIADIGCGTGAASIVLAQNLNATITAVDLFDDFLKVLQERAQAAGVADKIETLACSMDALPFEDSSFDLIWAEGAIYNIGFENGISQWRRFLKPGGLLVASEITWLTKNRPHEVEVHWMSEYPEIASASEKLRILENHGYMPSGYFVLPESCWLTNYYEPMQASFDAFLSRNGNSEEARAIVAQEQHEIALYEKYKAYYSYGMYLARMVE